MIDLEKIRGYFNNDTVFVTNHAAEKFRERSIRIKDIENAVLCGEIIEQYPDDFPCPSCLIFGKACDGRPVHTVMSDEETGSRIITAYIPDTERWEDDYKTRKESTSS